MARYIYVGPTHELGRPKDTDKLTIKLPLSKGGFQVIQGVVPGKTVFEVTDQKAMAHLESIRDLHGKPIYKKS